MTLLMGLFLKVQGDDTTDEGKLISGAVLTCMYISVMVMGFFAIAMAIPCCRRKCFKEEEEEEINKKGKNKKKNNKDKTKVMPMSTSSRAEALREMKEARLKYGASSKEYKTAAKKVKCIDSKQRSSSSKNTKNKSSRSSSPNRKAGQKKNSKKAW